MTLTDLAKAKRRRSAIVKMRDRGTKLREIAARFSITVQRVHQILTQEAKQPQPPIEKKEA